MTALARALWLTAAALAMTAAGLTAAIAPAARLAAAGLEVGLI
jgi:hypothetical protein